MLALYFSKEEEEQKNKSEAEWYDLMLLSLKSYIFQGTTVQFLSSSSRVLLHVEV